MEDIRSPQSETHQNPRDDLSKLRIDKSGGSRGRRRRRRFYWAAVVILAGLTAAFLYGTGILPPSVPVRVARVTRIYPSQSLTLLNASGYVVAQRKSALASKVTGRLVWLGVEEGSKVGPGDIIARLESRDVAANLEQARANIKTAQSNLDQAKAELSDAELTLQRTRELVSKGYIAQAEHDTARSRYDKARAAVQAGEATVVASRAALKGAEVAVEYTLIRAPFRAVVLTKNADVGDIVTPLGAAATAKASVVTVADLSSLKVETDVSESNLEQVKKGQPCEIQLDALPGSRFEGKVHMIVPTADRSKATVLVKVGFVENNPRILPEMSAKVAFLSRDLVPGEKIPRTGVNRSAVMTRNGKKFVFVIRDGKAFEVPITTGERFGEMEEVRQGVEAGERVVVSPPPRLKNGSRTKILEG